MARFFSVRLDDERIERRTKNGRNDRGDLTGIVTPLHGRVVVECKDYGGRFEVGTWLAEAEVEAANDDAPIGVVVAKRRGTRKPEEQVVFMTAETFARLLQGGGWETEF
jgi:hypothetical protein